MSHLFPGCLLCDNQAIGKECLWPTCMDVEKLMGGEWPPAGNMSS